MVARLATTHRAQLIAWICTVLIGPISGLMPFVLPSRTTLEDDLKLAATLMGVEAVVLVLGVCTIGRRLWPTPKERIVAGSSVLLFLLVAAVFLAAVAFQVTGDEQAISTTLYDATQTELDAYKNPTDPLVEPKLEQYFLSAAQYGARISGILTVVHYYEAHGRRQADSADRTIEIIRISISRDRNTATAVTRELWYQPLVDLNSGQAVWQDHLFIDQPEASYILKKVNGRWLIQSNPTPINPAVVSPQT
jgi:hypothetical protein